MELITYSQKPLSVDLIGATFEAAFKIKFVPEYWEWRFLKNPFSKKVYIAYAIDNGKLAGYYAVSPVTVQLGNQEYKFALSNMTMTHPDYQGQGLFKQLANKLYTELKEEGFDGVVGFANHNSHHGFKKHLGWIDLSALMLFQSDKNKMSFEVPSSIVFKDEPLDESMLSEMKSFIESKSPDKIQFSHTTDFLKWRLIDLPGKNYCALRQYENNKLCSCTIYKAYGSEIDLMAHFESAEITESENYRIQFSIGFLQKQYNAVLNLWSNIHQDEHLVLEKSGFKETTFSTYFGIIPFTERSTKLTNYTNWHVRFIDSDVF